jgi:hypothetical protein
MIFLWVLTWYSYWIFMKTQINAINIIGAVISAGLLVFSHFSPFRNAASKALKLATSQISKNGRLTHTSLGSQSNIKIQIPTATFIIKSQTHRCNQVKKSPRSTTVLKNQIPEPESPQPTDKSPQSTSKSNSCPKNLEYFTKIPRPKQTPEECITCKNLITCVCLTNN